MLPKKGFEPITVLGNRLGMASLVLHLERVEVDFFYSLASLFIENLATAEIGYPEIRLLSPIWTMSNILYSYSWKDIFRFVVDMYPLCCMYIVATQERHGEFEPGKAQFFFDRLFFIRAYWKPKSRQGPGLGGALPAVAALLHMWRPSADLLTSLSKGSGAWLLLWSTAKRNVFTRFKKLQVSSKIFRTRSKYYVFEQRQQILETL